MSDDLSMAALGGPIGARAAASLKAGCDVVLHCNGRMDEMTAIAAEITALAGVQAERAARADAVRRRNVAGRSAPPADAPERLAALLSRVGTA